MLILYYNKTEGKFRKCDLNTAASSPSCGSVSSFLPLSIKTVERAASFNNKSWTET